MSTSELDILAKAAAEALVTAATTDAWGKVKRMVAGLLGRGDAAKSKKVSNRLEETRSELTTTPVTGQPQALAAQEDAWHEHIAAFLAAYPEAEMELRRLVDSISTELRAAHVSAEGHGQAIGRVSISADGGIAAWEINGSISFSTASLHEPRSKQA